SSARITLRNGRVVTAALALTGTDNADPLIEVRTAASAVTFAYTADVLTYPDGRTSTPGRVVLFEQFLDHLDTGAPQLSALIDAGVYMEVLEAVRTAPAPTPIADAALERHEDRIVLPGIAEIVERTAKAGELFREAGVGFAG